MIESSVLNTPQKLAIAKSMSAVLRGARRWFGLSDRATRTRNGIHWNLDLAEGIDLSIYLLGEFEPSLVAAYTRLIRPGACVLDIGANIGAHTLQFAKLVGDRGKVVAYEPTRYAFEKLQSNLHLNPALARCVTAIQAMLVSRSDEVLAAEIVSSWPLDASPGDGRHRYGRMHSTAGAVALTLDESLRRLGASTAVDFIKLDVDGNEPEVLRGAEALMRECKPILFLELAPYEHRDPGHFNTLVEMLWGWEYDFCIAGTATKLPRSARELRARIPRLGSVNVIATRDR